MDCIRYEMDPVKILAAVYASRWTAYSWIEGLRARLWWLKDDRARWNCAEMVHDVILGDCDHALTPDGLYALMKGGDTIGN